MPIKGIESRAGGVLAPLSTALTGISPQPLSTLCSHLVKVTISDTYSVPLLAVLAVIGLATVVTAISRYSGWPTFSLGRILAKNWDALFFFLISSISRAPAPATPSVA